MRFSQKLLLLFSLTICSAAQANAHVLTISRTICTNSNVAKPQTTDVVYYRQDRPYPCRVFYTVGGKTTEKGGWNNSPGGCERVEKNIVSNLHKAQYACVHENVYSMPTPAVGAKSHFARRNLSNPNGQFFSANLDQFEKEEDAALFASVVRRKLPFVPIRIEQQSGKFHVLIAEEERIADVRALLPTLEGIVDTNAKIIRSAGNLSKDIQTWQRYTISACYRRGAKSARAIAECAGLRVSKNTLSQCLYGGLCRVPEVVPSIENSVEDLIADLPATALELVEIDTSRIETCRDSLNGRSNWIRDCGIDALLSNDQRVLLNCAERNSNSRDFLLCAGSSQIGGDSARLSSCVDASDSAELARCITQESIDPQVASALDCAEKEGRELALCLGGTFGDETAQNAVACLSDDSDDWTSKALCLGKDQMSDDQKKAVECFSRTDSVAGFAICAAGDDLGLTPEQQILAECAVSTGGEPISLAVCAGGRLTVRELQKCLAGEIGGDGCFGDNNEIVKFHRNAVSDITKGPGPNNEIVKVREAILGDDNGEVARLIRDPGKRTLDIAGNVLDEAGNVLDEAGNVIESIGEAVTDALEDLNPF